MKYFKSPILHPVLFAAYPILFLYAQNVMEMRIGDILLPLFWSLIFAIGNTFLLGLSLRDYIKSGLVSSVCLLLFFSFGHIQQLFPTADFSIGTLKFSTSTGLLLVWIGLLVVSIMLILGTKNACVELTKILNIIIVGLVAFQIFSIGLILLSRKDVKYTDVSGILKRNYSNPDVYFVVLDGYADNETLRRIYSYDNTEFLDFLGALGFKVFDKSYSNYCQTLLSLSSTMNMNYLSKLGDFEIYSKDRMPMAIKLKENNVFREFRALDYKIYAFSSGYIYTEFDNVDTYLKTPEYLSEFQNLLMKTTFLSIASRGENSLSERHRIRVRSILSQIYEIKNMRSQKFVFAHVICPHPPFLFQSDGSLNDDDNRFWYADGSHRIKKDYSRERYVEGYRGQVIYINELLKKTVYELLKRNAEAPPIIVILADHGPGSRLRWTSSRFSDLDERFSILQAIYFPNTKDLDAPDYLSPVNIFRYIFNVYFDGDYEMLRHESFYTTWKYPYRYQDITKALKHSGEIHEYEAREFEEDLE